MGDSWSFKRVGTRGIVHCGHNAQGLLLLPSRRWYIKGSIIVHFSLKLEDHIFFKITCLSLPCASIFMTSAGLVSMQTFASLLFPCVLDVVSCSFIIYAYGQTNLLHFFCLELGYLRRTLIILSSSLRKPSINRLTNASGLRISFFPWASFGTSNFLTSSSSSSNPCYNFVHYLPLLYLL